MNRLIYVLLLLLLASYTKAQCTLTCTTTSTGSCSYSDAGVGTATFNISGGTPPYYYSVDYMTMEPISSGETIHDLIAGTFPYTIYDNAGCTYSDSLHIPLVNIIPGATITTTSTPETCAGISDGAITVNVTGPDTYGVFITG